MLCIRIRASRFIKIKEHFQIKKTETDEMGKRIFQKMKEKLIISK